MALRTRGIVTQVAKESSFGVVPNFSDSDVILAEKVTINPKVDMVDRKVLSCSQIKEAGVPVRFTTSGDISMEINGTSDNFYGAVLYEAGLGAVNVATGDNGTGCFIGHDGNDTNGPAVDAIVKADNNHAGEATLYTVSDGVERISVAIKKFYDSGDVVLLSTGNVVNKVDLTLNQADILTVSFGLEGAGYDTLTGQTKPACPAMTEVPFVGQNATFKFYGNTVAAKNISVSIQNTITNIEAITSAGYSDKQIVEKQITGSFTALLEDFGYLDKLTNQIVGELYTAISIGSKKLGLYLPSLKITDVQITDDSGKLIEVQVNFTAEKANSGYGAGEALMLAIDA